MSFLLSIDQFSSPCVCFGLKQVSYPSVPDPTRQPEVVQILHDLDLEHLLGPSRPQRSGGIPVERGELPPRGAGARLRVNDMGPASATFDGGTFNASGDTHSVAKSRGGANATAESLDGSTRDLVRDWASELSPGEQQRLGFARVLYHRPDLAFLDEGTSAVAEDAEDEIYAALRQAHVTVVSVGHRTSLRRFHEEVLTLSSSWDGTWELSAI